MCNGGWLSSPVSLPLKIKAFPPWASLVYTTLPTLHRLYPALIASNACSITEHGKGSSSSAIYENAGHTTEECGGLGPWVEEAMADQFVSDGLEGPLFGLRMF